MAVTTEESTTSVPENNSNNESSTEKPLKTYAVPLPDYVVSHGAYIPPQSPIYEQAHLQQTQQQQSQVRLI